MDSQLKGMLLKWRVLTDTGDGVVVGSANIDGISYQELVEVAETILRLEDSRAATYLIRCFVRSEWTRQYLDPMTGPIVTEKMHVYALLPRELALRLFELASRWDSHAFRRKLLDARAYLKAAR